MTCKLTFSLLSETQEGNVGSDWKYSLEVKVFSEGLRGQGTINVDKHVLDPGASQPPPGPPEPLVLEVGDCGSELLIQVVLTATEVDLLKNDSGTCDSSLVLKCPRPGETPVAQEIELSAGVRESPGILNKNAVFTVKARIFAACY